MASRSALALFVIALAGCGSPLPTSIASPGMAQTNGPTPAATDAPTPTPIATASLPIDHPAGPTDVVLRMSSGGRLRYLGPTFGNGEKFTLYGDGRVIYETPPTEMPPSQVSPLLAAQLTEEQVSALLGFALGECGMAEARDEYPEPSIADAGTTTFFVDAGGFLKYVSVYALGYEGDETPDRDARRAFEQLATWFQGFGSVVASGEVVDLGEFRPASYQVSLTRITDSEVKANAEWPWGDLDLADFGPIPDDRRVDRTIEAAQGEAVLALDTWDALIVTGPDEALYEIRIRPLLPDEVPL